jgi:hypothetical protein
VIRCARRPKRDGRSVQGFARTRRYRRAAIRTSKDDIRARLPHTTTETSEIYIKEVIVEKSSLESLLPW